MLRLGQGDEFVKVGEMRVIDAVESEVCFEC